MTPQVEGGLELAQAIDSLARVLSRASLQVQQGESGFRLEPVELALQVTAARIGPGLDGIEWRVLGLGDQAVSQAGTPHRLTMRFAPRSPGRVSRQDTKEQGFDRRTIVQEMFGSDRLPEPLNWPRNRETERPESVSEVIAVRVRYLGVGQPGRLVIEQKFERRPSSPESDRELAEIRQISAETHPGHAERERLVEATAEYVASRLGSGIVGPVTYRWEIQGLLDPAAVSNALDRSQQWLQGLVERPIERAATPLGVPPALAGALGAIGANVVTAPVARDVQGTTQIIDVIGIIIGSVAGIHPLVIASVKHLANTEFQQAVAGGVTKVFDGLLAGSIDEPPFRPVSHPTHTLRPAGPASQLPTPSPGPAAPAEQTGPQPPISPAPGPAAPDPKPPIRPTPGISGPGGLG